MTEAYAIQSNRLIFPVMCGLAIIFSGLIISWCYMLILNFQGGSYPNTLTFVSSDLAAQLII